MVTVGREDFVKAVQDEAALRSALGDADPVTVLMLVAHLSGDSKALARAQQYIAGPFGADQNVPEPVAREAVEELVALLRKLAGGGAIPELHEADLHRIMNIGVGEQVPAEYLPMALAENQLDVEHKYRQFAWTKDVSEALRDFSVVVIGCGVSGIIAGVRLRQAGIPFVILDKNQGRGGTWWENNFPGAGLDTPADTYAFSFHLNKSATRPYIKRDEVLDYLNSTISAFGLQDAIIYGAEVTEARFLEDSKRWQVHYAKDGARHTLTPNIVISAVGLLNTPKEPPIKGREHYTGQVLHTARWDTGTDLTGRRVAMIGIGASGMQTGPAIAPVVGHLEVFQRSPHWAFPEPLYFKDHTPGGIWAAKHVPYFAAWRRLQVMWMGFDRWWPMMQKDSQGLKDMREFLSGFMARELEGRPDLLEKVKPDFLPFAKRMLYYNNWYPMLRRENVELVTSPIDRFTRDGILTQDGVEHQADVTIFATGFDMTRALGSYQVIGRDGVNLRDLWAGDEPRAYMGVAIPRLPNFFTLFGPNSALAHGGSLIFVSECQMNYAMQAIQQLIEGGRTSLECQQPVHDAYNQRLDQANNTMVWSTPGVDVWYKNAAGRITATSPWRLIDLWNMTRTFKPEEYNWTN